MCPRFDIFFSLSHSGSRYVQNLVSSCLSQGTVLITYAKQKFFLLMKPSVIWYAKRNEQEATMVYTLHLIVAEYNKKIEKKKKKPVILFWAIDSILMILAATPVFCDNLSWTEGFNQHYSFIKCIQLKLLIISPSGGGEGKLNLNIYSKECLHWCENIHSCLQNQFQTQATYN